MIRSLLADRFRLVTHVESRQLQTYTLALTRNDRTLGPQLQAVEVDCVALAAAARRGAAPPPPPTPGKARPCSMVSAPGFLLAGAVGLADFTESLSHGAACRGRSHRPFRPIQYRTKVGTGSNFARSCRCFRSTIRRSDRPVDLYRTAGTARSEVGINERAGRCPRHRQRRASDGELEEKTLTSSHHHIPTFSHSRMVSR
jgi:hypothetical protein